MCECGHLHINAKAPNVLQDPTMQHKTRTRAAKDLLSRLKRARASVIAKIKAMPAVIIANKAEYSYQVDPYVDAKVMAQQSIYEAFETGGDKPFRFYFDQYVTQAYTAGESQSSAWLLALALLAGASKQSVDSLKIRFSIFEFSQFGMVTEQTTATTSIGGFADTSGRAKPSTDRAYDDVKVFTDQLSTSVSRAIGDGVENGDSTAVIAAAVGLLFDKAASKAKALAGDEVSEAYRVARRDTAKEIAAALGLDVKVMHRSALLPTTRAWHAARHGRIYTIAQQSAWWAEGGNRYNCYCSVIEVIVDKSGKVYDMGMQKKLSSQRVSYFKLAA